jgi:4-alpha-glucanotransferase
MINQPDSGALARDRQAGVCLHITSLPGHYGIGEIGDEARRFVDEMVRMNLRVWQFLPTGPTGFGNSPYQPLSTFAGNEMLIELANLIRFGLLSSSEVDSLLKLPRKAVDFAKLMPKKTALLQKAASRFDAQARSETRGNCDAFIEKHNDAWLHDYALFRILKARHGEKPWTEWEPQYIHREPGALKRIADENAREIEYLKIIQFIFFRQWDQLKEYANGRGITMFGDMPIYIALDSADAWANPDILNIDENGVPESVAGVPPDYFSEDGQLWGNPLYNWDYHSKTDYAWWKSRIRQSLELADIVRIDHFRALEAYWAIPSDAGTARNGEWRHGPGDAILDAIRKDLGHLPFIAEDLGYITPEVDALRDQYALPGMRVLQFDLADPHFDPAVIPANSACYSGTHDNDTTVGWFRGSPGDKRSAEEILATQKHALAVTNGQQESIHTDVIKLALSSNARLAIIPLQDFLGLGSEARFNVPGTIGDNWRWRFTKQELSRAAMDAVARMVDDAGRAGNT